MTKRLFTVTIETEILVVAESEAEAAKIAESDVEVEWHDSDYIARPMDHMPTGWDDKCIPFGDRLEEDPDRTVGKWMEAGAAPEFAQRRRVIEIEEDAK